ncbi:glutathione S-transferase family protein [Rhizobacter sp. Root1221]|uniref:glutathione S-transferase family protein n=1 Tax=Rhizobacter sp. Root1221 TaxID=1736433 RepID=UPI0006F48DAD|nr:glutathione S-transferase family protein [Rhizobacter sp. Root1221]KQV91544.1 glutathione S-transferase [Rhizobacter sp. Root1221]
MKLYIGNKNYSSWSMRPWVLLTEAGIPFEEVVLRFDSFDPHSAFKTEILKHNPTGRVPVLVDGDFPVWDSLAIAEYVAERFPEKNLWPADPRQRARARSVCAEMHSGFAALREHWGMNIEAHLADVGARVLAEQPALRADLDRIVSMWTQLLAQSGGPMLFGHFTIADAFFAPVVTRLVTYGAPVPAAVKGYVDRVLALRSVSAWYRDAQAEHDFLQFEENYRTGRA